MIEIYQIIGALSSALGPKSEPIKQTQKLTFYLLISARLHGSRM
jgi:hypothetical protein